ncbi:MAG: hypothetical protein J6W75_04320 [Bacteroidaceae bacterium]|nr:hypothetical protein [Bacteroidaceae bacterium]
MKKIKLFLAAVAAMVTMGASAQTDWEGVSSITSGKSYYIVNDATGLFITPGNNWGTRATLDESPAGPATVTLSNGKYTIVFTNPNGGNGLFVDTNDGSSLFCDRNDQANYFWTITSNGDKTFNVQLASDQARYVEGSYLTAESGNVWANVQYNSSNETYRKWRFISVEDVKTTMVNSEETLDVSLLVHGAQGPNNIGASNNSFDRYKARYAWTFSGNDWKGQNNQTLTGFNKYWIECWSGSALTSRTASKTVSDLPAGHYKISAYTVGGDGVEWFAQIGNGAKVTAATTGNPPTQTSVELDLTETSNITLGIQSNSTTTVGWIAFDNVTMEYSSFKKAYLDKLEAANALATSLSGTIPTAVVNALNSTITTYTDVTSDYLSAISALNTAMGTANEAANTLGANYARYTSIKSAAKAISNDVDATSADAAVEAATTNSAIDAAIVTLRAAFLAELPNVSIPNDPGYIDVTGVMVDNASVRQNTGYWTIEGTPNGGYSWAVVSNEECEFYQQNFKFYQTLALTPGTWEFGVTGFHRAGNHTTNFYAGEDKILIPGVESSVVNTMAQAKTYFDGGNGKVALKFLIESAGDVEIGIHNQDTQTDKWTIFRDFTLKYYGAPDYTVYENQWADLVAAANTAKTTYANCNGSELTALNAAIADSPEGSNLKATYLEKIEALQTALNTFNAAGPNYEALAREIVKAKALGMDDEDVDNYAATSSTTAATALTSTQALMVDEYNYVATNYSHAVELGTWNASANAGTLTGQHWDDSGIGGSSYLEQGGGDLAYNLPSWTVTYDQTLFLPAGSYIFKVAGRTATDHVTINLNVTDVTDGENPVQLGTVNDFPKGDVGLGINKAGATSFDAEDAEGFANNGIGRGWQWRYVKFTLANPASVQVAVVAEADAQYRWMSFCNATVQTDDADNVALMQALVALNDAKAAATLTQRANVGTGVFQYEATNDGNLWSAYSTAKSNAEAFTLAANTEVEEVTALTTALTTAQANYSSNAVINAPDASKRYNVSIVDDGQAWDGNAITFIAGGRTDMGNFAVQYLASANAYMCQALKFTAVEGEDNTYKISAIRADGGEQYLTTGSTYEGGNNTQIRTTDDASKASWVKIQPAATSGQFQLLNVSDGNKVIGRNATNPDNGMYTDGNVSFTIAEASQASVTVSCQAGKFGTVIFPFAADITALSGVKFYSCESVHSVSNRVQIEEVSTLEANVPYLIQNEGADNFSKAVSGWGVATADSYTDEAGLLTGVYTNANINGDNRYVLQTPIEGENEGVQAFYKVKSDFTATPYKCYLTYNAGADVKMLGFDFGGEDAINGIEAETENAEIFNLAGQRVNKAQKGIYIVNGKKVAVK